MDDCTVMLSAAKHLAAPCARPFAALRVTPSVHFSFIPNISVMFIKTSEYKECNNP